VAVGVSVGRGVDVGSNVAVREGVKLSTAGWKGVGVALAFGSTVTRLRGGDEAGGNAGRVQAARMSANRKMDSARLRITEYVLRNAYWRFFMENSPS
jgi:hypothetical protein